MNDSQTPEEHWVGERWVIEDLDDAQVEVAVATARVPWLFKTMADAGRPLESAATLADVAGILRRIERDVIDDAWSDELGYRLPLPEFAGWLRERVEVAGLFPGGTHLEPGMVFLIVVDEAVSSGDPMTFPRLGEPGSIRAFRRTWEAGVLSDEPGESGYWRYLLSMYASNSRVFDLTPIAHAAVADLYEEALWTANGRPNRG